MQSPRRLAVWQEAQTTPRSPHDPTTNLAFADDARDADCWAHALHFNGKKKLAYAMKDHKEYFAELSEAWFGKNDIYPFVQAEAKEYDPGMAKLLPGLWGVQPRPKRKSNNTTSSKPKPETVK